MAKQIHIVVVIAVALLLVVAGTWLIRGSYAEQKENALNDKISGLETKLQNSEDSNNSAQVKLQKLVSEFAVRWGFVKDGQKVLSARALDVHGTKTTTHYTASEAFASGKEAKIDALDLKIVDPEAQKELQAPSITVKASSGDVKVSKDGAFCTVEKAGDTCDITMRSNPS